MTINSQYTNWFGNATIGNPAINGIPTNSLALPYGSTVTNSIDTYVEDTNNLGRRVEASAATSEERTELVIDFLGSNTTVVIGWTEQYRYGVSAGPGGTVTGTTNGWYGAKTVTNTAVAEASCEFQTWSNAPTGQETQNPLIFELTNAFTNVIAHFALKPATLQAARLEEGQPGFGAGPFPNGFTVVVQRSEDLLGTNWQNLAPLPPGATNWQDPTSTGDWQSLFYRLAE